MKYIKGHKRKLYLLDRDTQEFNPVVCLTSTDYSQVVEMIEKVNVCEKSERPRSINRSVSFSGEVALNGTGKTIDDLYLEQELSRTRVGRWRLCGGASNMEFDAYLTDASDSYADGDATFSGSLTIVGKVSDVLIVFEDANVLSILEDGGLGLVSVDGGFWLKDIVAITGLNDAFQDSSLISSIERFNEFKYFTGLEHIGTREFQGANNLSTITLPPSLLTIGDEAFLGCTQLSKMTILAVAPPTYGDEAISGGDPDIYVPANSVSAYKAAIGWSEHASKIYPIT